MGDSYAARAYKLCGKGPPGRGSRWNVRIHGLPIHGTISLARVHCKFAIFAECCSMLCFGIGFGKKEREVSSRNRFWPKCILMYSAAGRRKEIWKNRHMLFGNPMDSDSDSDGGNCSMGGRSMEYPFAMGGGKGYLIWLNALSAETAGWVENIWGEGAGKIAGTRMANFPLCSLNQNCNKTKVMNRILAMAKLFLLPHSMGIYLSHILSLFSCGSCNLFNYFNGIFLLSVCRYYGAFVDG